MVDLVLKLHSNVLLGKCIDNFGSKLPFRPEFYQFLLLSVKNDQEYILSTENRQLYCLLNNTTFSLAIRNISLIFVIHVFNVTGRLFKHIHQFQLKK